MRFALVNGRVMTPSGLMEGQSVVVDGARIEAITDAPPADVERVDLDGQILLPGFIDTQVNGGGGVLFNDTPTVEGIEAIGAAHRRFGTTGFLPTLISDDFSVIRAAVRAVDAAIEAGVPGVLGIHIEGPFLNVERKGIHDASKFRALDEEAFAILTSLKRGRTLVTLAPEKTDLQTIRRLVAAGVIVAAGHTNATYETTKQALASGLTGFTHLFNAMSPLTSRKPGVVGAALESQDAWCGIIVDGRHVDPATLKIALAARPKDRFMLVTDAMPTVGSPDGAFELQGRRIVVKDGACYDENGVLAGSDLDMATAVRNVRDLVGVDLRDASTMASGAPAAFLRLDRARGCIAPGLAPDLVAVNDDLAVSSVWIGGERHENAVATPSTSYRRINQA